MFSSRKHQAFTLIELLIVVAIIAILAAIAVPNFLEAQTRAKVSKVKSDMRSLTTALESYYVDHNNYVPAVSKERSGFVHETGSSWTGRTEKVTNTQNPTGGFFHMLSTPVAYIANSYIRDPFPSPIPETSFGNAGNAVPYVNQFIRYTAFNKARPAYWQGCGDTAPYYWGKPVVAKDYGADEDPQIVWWMLWSVGPDQEEGAFVDTNGTLDYWAMKEYVGTRSQLPPGIPNYSDVVNYRVAVLSNIYDPTNGTKSQGNIWRLGGGSPGLPEDSSNTYSSSGPVAMSYKMYFTLRDAAE